jgi:hypothetical protein
VNLGLNLVKVCDEFGRLNDDECGCLWWFEVVRVCCGGGRWWFRLVMVEEEGCLG